jgi:hypothetical protein
MAHMTNNDIKKILSKIGNKVKFEYPGKEGSRHGILKDRVAIPIKKAVLTSVPYCDVVDLIEFKGKKQKLIRIGYYRKKRELNWGSQTTITETISGWKDLLIKTAREKEWFRKILKEVIKKRSQWDK